MLNENVQKIFQSSCLICNKDIFSNLTLENCNICGSLINKYIELHNPIQNIKPKCLIITKSLGSLHPGDYSNSDILHTGISNSKGKVYNFWFNYNIDKKSHHLWKNVINIELDLTDDTDKIFDDILEDDFVFQKKNYPKYQQFENNCYDYICRFFNRMKYRGREWDKYSLALCFIEPKILILDKFSSIYKKLFSQLYSNSSQLVIYEDLNTFDVTCSVCDSCNEIIRVNKRNRCNVCNDYDMCDTCYSEKGHEHKMEKI